MKSLQDSEQRLSVKLAMADIAAAMNLWQGTFGPTQLATALVELSHLVDGYIPGNLNSELNYLL